MFESVLKRIVDNTGGALGAVIMGYDGIPVQSVGESPSIDIEAVAMEYSFVLSQVKTAAANISAGTVNTATVEADNIRLVLHTIDDDYFCAVILGADGNVGKCKFLLRVSVPKLREMF